MTSPRDVDGERAATPASPIHVDAVIVSHDGEQWIPQLIRALDASAVGPARVIAVDTGSNDRSADLLTASLGTTRVVGGARNMGFGAAVATGIAALDAELAGSPEAAVDPASQWVWLLHDDCAPAPDALAGLLAIAEADPTVTVVGCRVRAWPRARRLLEVGVTITGTGHRETGLEPGEYDQGQHDGIRRVLAVSSAGMLVRRDQWNAMRGFEARLPLFRDDVDFGWRVAKSGGKVVISPDAVIFHAEAASRGARAIDNTSRSPHRADRKAALFTVLANCRTLAFPFQYIRLIIGSLLRALGYLAGKLPGAARDEVLAMLAVALRPDRLIAARWRRRRTSTAPRADVRALLPSWWTPYANGLDSMLSRFADTVRETATSVTGSARRLGRRPVDPSALETGPTEDETLPGETGAGPVAWIARHPATSLGVFLTALAIGANRGLWGGGLLQGGALLPAPDSAGDWWSLYGQAWHAVALGSPTAPSPYVVVLAVVSSALVGKAGLAVDVLMLLAVPLASVGAFAAARRMVAHPLVQLWAAVTYALLPVLSGAVTAGRIGTVVSFVLLPWMFIAARPLLDLTRRAPWRRAFAGAVVLAMMASFVPIAWVMAAALVVLAVPFLVISKAPARIVQLVAVLAVSAALLLPWSWRFVTDPSLLLTEAGVVDPRTADVSGVAWQLPFGRIAAAGDAPWWLTAGIIVAAIVAMIRTDRLREVVIAWVVIAIGLLTAGVLAGRVVHVPHSSVTGWVWLGFPVLVAQAAAVTAAAVAADGIAGYVEAGRFGWRQPVIAVTAVVAVLAPLAGAAWWVVAAPRGELTRATETRFPAYLVDGLRSDDQHRVLVLTGDPQAVEYDLVMDDGVRLGDDSVEAQYSSRELDQTIASVLSAGESGSAASLAQFGIGFVMLPAPADPDLVTALDGLPGLTRASTDPRQVTGWKVDQPAGLARLLDPSDRSPGLSARVLPAPGGEVDSSIPATGGPHTLAFAVPPNQGFEATLDGKRVPSTDAGGTMAFDVGAKGGRLQTLPPGHRTWWVLGQAALWLLVLILAAPAAARRQGLEVRR